MSTTKASQDPQHSAILLTNEVDKKALISKLVGDKLSNLLPFLNQKKGLVFSDQAIKEVISEEERHDNVTVALSRKRKLKTFSSGERKKLFLEHCLSQNPDFLLLDNPLDHLDIESRVLLKELLEEIKYKIVLVQLANRKADILDFIEQQFEVDVTSRKLVPLREKAYSVKKDKRPDFSSLIDDSNHADQELIKLDNVSLAYGENRVLDRISWTIGQNEFWQLIGPNGSGKSSILAMITGDNVKGYGQEVYLFGKKKGTGESVWDIKKKIGYFSVAVLDLFKSDQKVIDMVLSGFYDSIGLYVKPTDAQQRIAREWLSLVGLGDRSNDHFSKLSEGGSHIVLILRAVIKNPPLVLLDEPVEGLDEENAQWVIRLINTLVKQTTMTVVYISHRTEPNLDAARIFELVPGEQGSHGEIWENFQRKR